MSKARKCTPVFADEHCLHLNKVYAEAAGAITALTEQLLEKTPTADLLRLQGVLLEAINGPVVMARLNRVLGTPRDDISAVLEPGDPEHAKFAKAWKAAPGTTREANEAAHKLLAEMTTKNLALGQLREAEARVAVLERNVLSLQDERNKAQQSIKGLEAELTETRKKYTEALGQCCVPRSLHVQMVPDHCDRITYKGEYLSIPVILRQAKENKALKMSIQSLLEAIQSAQDACDDVKASHMKTNEIVKGLLEKILGEKWETVPGNVTEAHKTLDAAKNITDLHIKVKELEQKNDSLHQGLQGAMAACQDEKARAEGYHKKIMDLIGINKSLPRGA